MILFSEISGFVQGEKSPNLSKTTSSGLGTDRLFITKQKIITSAIVSSTYVANRNALLFPAVADPNDSILAPWQFKGQHLDVNPRTWMAYVTPGPSHS